MDRRDDPRISTMVKEMADLKTEMAKNTAVTQEVMAILESFHIMERVAKWCTVMMAAISAAISLVIALKVAVWPYLRSKLL